MSDEEESQTQKRLAAMARVNLSDLMSTYQQVMGASEDETVGWMQRMVTETATLRGRQKGRQR